MKTNKIILILGILSMCLVAVIYFWIVSYLGTLVYNVEDVQYSPNISEGVEFGEEIGKGKFQNHTGLPDSFDVRENYTYQFPFVGNVIKNEASGKVSFVGVSLILVIIWIELYLWGKRRGEKNEG
jgi:hypothetical protein